MADCTPAPVVLEFDMTSGRRQTSFSKRLGDGHTPSNQMSVPAKPWRKSAAECSEERAAVRHVLHGERNAGCGVDVSGLQVALRAQEIVDQSRASNENDALQAAVDKLRQAATNATSFEEVTRAQDIVEAAAARLIGEAAARERLNDVPSNVGAFARKMHIMHEVMPRLWLGGWQALSNKCEALAAKSVTHVVSVISADKRALPPFIVQHYHALVDDNEDAADTLAQHFDRIVTFIEDARTGGGTVFVHCGAGISRAPTVTAAYMTWKLQVPASAALNLIRRSRPCIRPNVGFAKQLKAWERQVLAPRESRAFAHHSRMDRATTVAASEDGKPDVRQCRDNSLDMSAGCSGENSERSEKPSSATLEP